MAADTTLEGLSFLTCQLRMPLMDLPVRSTIVQLPSARVLVSPGSKLTPSELAAAGEITDIVATNLFHLDGAVPAARAHPKARLWGPPGAAAKLATVSWNATLGTDPWPFEEQLTRVAIDGMPKMVESVFLHQASRTLIVADLAFNIEDPHGFGAWLILSIFGTHGRFGVSRLFKKLIKDRALFEASLAKLRALEFDNLVPAHGAVLRGNAKAKLTEALQERGFAS